MLTVCPLVDTGGQQCYYSDSTAFYGRLLLSRRGVAFIKIDKSLTYRGDKSTSKYQSHKIFPEV